MSDRSVLKGIQAGTLASQPSSVVADPVGEVNKTHRRTYTWIKDAIDVNATDNTAELSVVKLNVAGKVVAASFTPIAVVASSATNTIQMTVSARLAADYTTAVVVANTLVQNTAATIAFTPVAITLVPSAAAYTANSVLTFKILKANSGVAMCQGVLSVEVEET